MHRTLRKAVMHADRKLGRLASPLISLGSARSCRFCGWTGWRFLAAGEPPSRRTDARCPRCSSKERHRFAHILLGELGSGHRTLHVAPEPQTAAVLRTMSNDYLSIDLRPGIAMRTADLTKLDLPSDSFSLIFCSHVLEHIADDHAAIEEMGRVVQADGVVVILVPLDGLHTDEEPIDDPEERFRRYGLEDHVRLYGLDVIERLEGVFAVEHRVTTAVAESDRRRLGLGTTEHAFICRPKPQ